MKSLKKVCIILIAFVMLIVVLTGWYFLFLTPFPIGGSPYKEPNDSIVAYSEKDKYPSDVQEILITVSNTGIRLWEFSLGCKLEVLDDNVWHSLSMHSLTRYQTPGAADTVGPGSTITIVRSLQQYAKRFRAGKYRLILYSSDTDFAAVEFEIVENK